MAIFIRMWLPVIIMVDGVDHITTTALVVSMAALYLLYDAL